MKRRLDSLVDKGVWISHDRIYAFVSSDNGITEVGYHGLQPVSKNSRLLVRDSGVLTLSVQIGDQESVLQTHEVDSQPTRIIAETLLSNAVFTLVIEASGRVLRIRCSSTADTGSSFCLRLSKESLFRAVHGVRTWNPPQSKGEVLTTSFRDTIMLQEWLRRTGPYAGDFLIPEPVRKKIFRTSKRSGLATRDDLRPEFQTSDLTLYDEEGFVAFGGIGFSLKEIPDAWIFERAMPARGAAEFIVRCSDQAETHPIESEADIAQTTRPRLTLAGFPRLEEFASTVPGLVESCIVRDYGIPRACPGRYYWIWAWDALVTMQEALRWGNRTNALNTVRFIELHRTEDGIIPARWTRSLLPLDVPSPGGIEFLQAALAYETFLETEDYDLLREVLPSFIARFEAAESQLLEKGFMSGEGFYPDLLTAFGRTPTSSVCMEVGCWYAFCRVLENIAFELGDSISEKRASAAATAVARTFSARYWDEEPGFFADSTSPEADSRSHFHPLFALLFLQSSQGLPLVRPHLQKAARFIARDLLTDAGMRVIAAQEAGTEGEVVLDSWYPHWDLYGLKLLRRAGDGDSIMKWLKRSEEVLSMLGYCPEFLALKGFRQNDIRKWDQHGSASNLNCVTSWHRGLRESVIGFEFDPGGVTHLPLSLPLASARMEGIEWRAGSWTFESLYDGPHFESLSVDGKPIEGCMKLPCMFQTPGKHVVTARYGSEPMLPSFTEIVNAKVLITKRLHESVEVSIEPLGFADVAFFSPDMPRIMVDNHQHAFQWDRESGLGWFSLTARPNCTLRLEHD